MYYCLLMWLCFFFNIENIFRIKKENERKKKIVKKHYTEMIMHNVCMKRKKI